MFTKPAGVPIVARIRPKARKFLFSTETSATSGSLCWLRSVLPEQTLHFRSVSDLDKGSKFPTADACSVLHVSLPLCPVATGKRSNVRAKLINRTVLRNDYSPASPILVAASI